MLGVVSERPAGATLLRSGYDAVGRRHGAAAVAVPGVVEKVSKVEKVAITAASAVPGLAEKVALAAARSSSRSATVADICGRHGTVVCTEQTSLAKVAEALLARDRTSAIIASAHGLMTGAITENDLLNAYTSGVPGAYTVGAWLQSGCARIPNLEDFPCVGTTTTLLEAAELMTEQEYSELACRHVVIKDSNGLHRGIVSSLDVARALDQMPSRVGHSDCLRSRSVGRVMKARETLPTIGGNGTLMQAMHKMLAFHQNCVVVTAGGSDSFRGAVTTRDALRAFAENAPVGVTCAAWIRSAGEVERRFVSADLELSSAVTRMVEEGFHHLVVVSGSSDFVGVLSSSDVAHALAESPLG